LAAVDVTAVVDTVISKILIVVERPDKNNTRKIGDHLFNRIMRAVVTAGLYLDETRRQALLDPCVMPIGVAPRVQFLDVGVGSNWLASSLVVEIRR
jgi:hypothetical protein